MGPVQSVEYIREQKSDGTYIDLSTDDYQLISDIDPSLIRMKKIPSVYGHNSFFQISYSGGYPTSPSSLACPSPIRVKILEIANIMFDQRITDLDLQMAKMDDIIMYRSFRPF
jgi:hypothetical protein